MQKYLDAGDRTSPTESNRFLTSWEWAKWFFDDLTIFRDTDKSEYKFVTHVGKIGDATVVIAQHPQGKSEETQCAEILNAIIET